MERYDAVFINSGARGFGEFAYDSVEPDDTIISDPTAELCSDYLADGGTLVLSDWSADIIEALWPTTIQFAGEETVTLLPVGMPGRVVRAASHRHSTGYSATGISWC